MNTCNRCKREFLTCGDNWQDYAPTLLIPSVCWSCLTYDERNTERTLLNVQLPEMLQSDRIAWVSRGFACGHSFVSAGISPNLTVSIDGQNRVAALLRVEAKLLAALADVRMLRDEIEAEETPTDTMQTARAMVVASFNAQRPIKYKITEGAHAGGEFFASDDPHDAIGTMVTVRFHPDDQFARKVGAS